MAIDTQQKRRSVTDTILPWLRALHILPSGSGLDTKAERAQELDQYDQTAVAPVTVTNTIHYAVMLDTGMAAITTDCITAGVIRIVTDRPNYNGVTVIPQWGPYEKRSGSITAVWHEGYLLKDGLGKASRRIDITEAGNYGVLSGFTFTIKNDTKFWKICNDNEIWLTNKTVEFYVVINNVFYQVWQGIVTNNPYTETDFHFECESNYQSVHKTIPPLSINSTNFPSAVSDSKDKAIPVCIGEVPYASLINVDGEASFLQLTKSPIDNTLHNYAAIMSYQVDGSNMYTVWINTGLTNWASDSFDEKFLFITSGKNADTDTAIQIKDTYNRGWITDALAPGGGYYSQTLWIATPLPNTDPATFASSGYAYSYSGALTGDEWYCGVATLGTSSVVSQKKISEFHKDGTVMVLHQWNKTKDKFEDVTELIASSNNDTTTPSVPYPHISVLNNKISKDGTVVYNVPVVPSIFAVTRGSNGTGITGTITDNNLYDNTVKRDRTLTGWILDIYLGSYTRSWYLQVDINDPSIDAVKEATKAWIVPEFKVTITTGLYQYQIIYNFYDIYGRELSTLQKTILLDPGVPETTSKTFNFLPNSYYRNGGNDNSESSIFSTLNTWWVNGVLQTNQPVSDAFELSATALTALKEGKISKISVHLDLIGNATFTLELRQVGLFTNKKIAIADGSLFADAQGELYGTALTNTLPAAIKHLMVDYDGISASLLNTTILESFRNQWYVGRQLTDQQSSFDYLKELCAQSFVGMFVSRIGKYYFIPWLDTENSGAIHDETSIIRGSIKDFTKTDIEQIYTQFNLSYSPNPATDKFDRSIFIANVNQTSFPASTTLDTDGVTPLWYKYAGGLPATSYADAKYLWDICHAAYLRYGILRQPDDALIQCKWFIDRSLFDSTLSGASVDSTAYKFLLNLVSWTSRQKDTVQYQLSITTTTIVNELLDKIKFSDTIFTNSVQRDGWIVTLEVEPKLDVVNITSMVIPDDGMDDIIGGDIVETGIADVDVVESGSQPDTYTET